MAENKKRSENNGRNSTNSTSTTQKKPDSLKDTNESTSPAQENIAPIKQDQESQESAFPIVGIGASAGGLEAVEKFFTNMPPDTGIAFVVVMHFDPKAKSVMTDILKGYTKMEIYQVEDGMKVEPNRVYIIPPNKDMAILQRTLHLYEPVVSKGIRHPIDFFFRSLADDLKENAICIILSGTGTEGTLGLKAIKGEGGMVMVQSVESAAYDGMPGSAIATGLVDYILSPEKMPEQLISYVNRFYAKKITKPERIVTDQIANSLKKIIILIRTQIGIDFSPYKQNTIIRRIERRMSLHQIENISDYVRYLQENQAEIKILQKEFLIGVTSFFRDPAAFEALKEKVVPEILKNKSNDQPVRIWVPGCSTGEEAYSIAIVLKEYMDEVKNNFLIQIFATDVDRDAVEKGRLGVFPSDITVDVSPERLNRFFIRNPDTFQLKKEIREMVVFAPQNIISDPPFLRLDLISCRNLLIYLVAEAQKRLLPLFHYSLNPGGYLFLGSSETIGDFTELYSVVDKKWKIYKSIGERVHIPLMAEHAPIAPSVEIQKEGEIKAGEIKAGTINIGQKIEKILLDTYTPPCTIINEKGDIIYIHGRTGKYLEPAPGNIRFNIVDMAREGLRTELNIGIHRAVTQKKDAVFQNLNVKTNGAFQTIDLTVRPIKEPEMQGLIMVTFEDVPSIKPSRKVKSTYRSKQAKEHIAELENELKYTKENLQATVEELQTSNEELKSTNEELSSSNEELQSTNEELGASKEELQSLNEELSTLNSEHQAKIEELSKSVNDMSNVLASTEIATLFLDNDLRIKSYTPATTKVINLIKTDIGRPISDIVSNLENEDLLSDTKEVLDTLVIKEKEIKDKKRLWYLMRILPYRTMDNTVDGVVITFMDITERKRAEQIEKDSRVYTESILDTVQESLLVLDKDLRVISANSSFYSTFKVSPEETENKFIYDMGNKQWDIPRLRELLEEILPKNSQFKNFEVNHEFPGIGQKVMSLNARRIRQEGEGKERILLAIEDVTERKLAAE